MFDMFNLKNEVVIVTGGAGLLGVEHAIAIAEHGGLPVLVDISPSRMGEACERLRQLDLAFEFRVCDLGRKKNIEDLLEDLVKSGVHPTGLINNLDHNPAMTGGQHSQAQGFELYPQEHLEKDIHLGLITATLCSQVIGSWLAKQGGGSIINIASDLGIIAPDQRVYQNPAQGPIDWPLKPPSYSMSKFGLIGLTKYLAAYWGDVPVRVNAVALGSVQSNQSDYLVNQLESRIPLGRLAKREEYRGIIVFLLSRASSYMTGSVVVADGGRSVI